MPAINTNSKSKRIKDAARAPGRKAQRSAAESEPEISLPPAHDWRTTDEDEINRRRLRAREGSFVIRNSDTPFPVFSNFSVGSGSGLTYAVEIRDAASRRFACTCQDFMGKPNADGNEVCEGDGSVARHSRRLPVLNLKDRIDQLRNRFQPT